MSDTKGRILSGMRPTGRLHLGNYLGALMNWVDLQNEYECYYCVVDIHALTTLQSPEEVNNIQPNILEMVLDWLAAGLDPESSVIFVQSHVPEVLTLHALLSMITPMGWLMRVPTFKEKIRQMQQTDESVNYGLVGYPVLQTADIILYKGDTVPVGEDQLPHLELAREIVRRFNNMFGPTFPEPTAKLTRSPVIIGIDGQSKMSKSMDNHIDLASDPEETRKRLMTCFTDPQRTLRSIPGRPEICNVYSLHQIFNPENIDLIHKECTTATRGCVDCKSELAEGVNTYLTPFRERRLEFAAQKGLVDEILADGAQKARTIARATLAEVTSKMGIPSPVLPA